MNLPAFIILALACWRLSSLIVREEGPWDIFARFRYWLGVRYNAQSERISETMLGQLVTCVWCTSVWVSVLFFIPYSFFPNPTMLIASLLALSALTILIERLVGDGPS